MKAKKITIIFIYLLLTMIKLFTAEINSQREEDPTIYFKFYPTISNVFYGSDRHIEEYTEKYSWYENRDFWEICCGNSFYLLHWIYLSLIYLWWISTVLIILYYTLYRWVLLYIIKWFFRG